MKKLTSMYVCTWSFIDATLHWPALSCYKLQTMFLNSIIRERFSIECRETKPIFLLLPIITNVNRIIDQSELNSEKKQVTGVKRARSTSFPGSLLLSLPGTWRRENLGTRMARAGKRLRASHHWFWFCFCSSLFDTEWSEICQPIPERSKRNWSKRAITFDTQFKTALIIVVLKETNCNTEINYLAYINNIYYHVLP